MVNILHNIPVVIVYVIAMAACLITITVLDMQRIRATKRCTKAVEENTAMYNRLLDETEQDQKAREQYSRVIESYEESVNRNTKIYGQLVRLLEQEQQTGGQGAWKR